MNALFGWYSAQGKPVLLSMFCVPSLPYGKTYLRFTGLRSR
jgi:hypothetical protein